jgi:DNA-directed RNA polymerase subunit RPC12/RpoP
VVRFSCPVCKAALEHPTPGAKLPCPNCGQRLQVPQPPANKTVLGVLPTPAAPVLHFNCPACGSPLSAPEDCAGRVSRCRQCGQAVTVPAPSEAVLVADVEEVPDEDRGGMPTRFRCPRCELLCESPVASGVVTCPKCGQPIDLSAAPGPPPKPERPRVVRVHHYHGPERSEVEKTFWWFNTCALVAFFVVGTLCLFGCVIPWAARYVSVTAQ